jgi:hypothetical protein
MTCARPYRQLSGVRTATAPVRNKLPALLLATARAASYSMTKTMTLTGLSGLEPESPARFSSPDWIRTSNPFELILKRWQTLASDEKPHAIGLLASVTMSLRWRERGVLDD